MERVDFTRTTVPLRARRDPLVILQKPLETERFSLVCLDEDFATDTYLRWLSDDDTTAFLETRFAPVGDLLQLRHYVTSLLASTDSYLLAIVTNDTREHIGNIKLGPINSHHSTASIGLFIGSKDWWGKGVATETIAAVTAWAFDTVKLAKVCAGAYASNVASIRAFETCGFSREGLLRSQVSLNSGARDDVVMLGKVNPHA
ncbi:MAG: N-acetyltransferase [Microbacteriaceae bacterium]|nr:N-acetyltransferase [Microbacteriaceae bacterium]